MDIEELAADPNAAIQQMLDAPTPVTWRVNTDDPDRTLSEEQAEQTWAELTTWVDWLIDRYGIDTRTIPPCWAEHGAHVDELTALWGAWLVAYWPLGSAADPASWMITFAGTRTRLAEWTARRGCRSGDHRPETTNRQDQTTSAGERHECP